LRFLDQNPAELLLKFCTRSQQFIFSWWNKSSWRSIVQEVENYVSKTISVYL